MYNPMSTPQKPMRLRNSSTKASSASVRVCEASRTSHGTTTTRSARASSQARTTVATVETKWVAQGGQLARSDRRSNIGHPALPGIEHQASGGNGSCLNSLFADDARSDLETKDASD